MLNSFGLVFNSVAEPVLWQCCIRMLNQIGAMLDSGTEAFSLEQSANAFKDGINFHLYNEICFCNIYKPSFCSTENALRAYYSR
jgi:hypothetical protein